MRIEFSYKKRGKAYYPIIEIKAKTSKNEVGVKALIDSGASFSVFRPEIADYLGIKIEKGEPIVLTGIGGRILGYLHQIDVSLDRKNFFKCKIVFSKEYTVSLNILGRDNFFLPFLITFAEKKKKVILS
jgi:hypothetical protein